MSRSGTIKIKFNGNSDGKSPLELIQSLESEKWFLGDNGMISFLPVGDQDFDWEFVEASFVKKVKEIVQEKQELGELIGVSWTHCEEGHGVLALINPDLAEISLSLEIDRRPLRKTDLTDFSWYLENLVAPMVEKGLSLEHIECFDG